MSTTTLTTTRSIPNSWKTSRFIESHVRPVSNINLNEPTTPDNLYNQALIVTSTLQYEVVQLPCPNLENEEDVLIETRAVGLNPIDWKSVAYNFCLPEFPWVTGREMAGVVQRVGSKVKCLQVGDRVWTCTYYRKREAGCFQSYVLVPEHTVFKVPSGISFESAACLGVPGLTAAMTLWHWLKIPLPTSSAAAPHRLSQPSKEAVAVDTATDGKKFVLIWGGSTVTGQFAIQMAVASGLTVITVVSSKTSLLVQNLGAHHVIVRDGKSNEAIVAEVRQLTGDDLTFAIDIVGPKTAVMALRALSSALPSIIAPLSFMPADAQIPSNVAVKNVEMKQFVLNPENKVYAEVLSSLVADGKILFPSLEILGGGFAAIPAGLDRLTKGDMQGKKLIVKV